MSEPSRWITVGELAHAFAPDSNAARPTDALVGRSLDLHLENGETIRYRFETGDRLSWAELRGGDPTNEVEEAYFAAEVRPGIYFVDLLRHQERATTVSMVLDLGVGIVTVLVATLPEEPEARVPLIERLAEGKDLTAVSAAFLGGAVDRAFTPSTPRHVPTGDMVGKRVEYTYSPTERYEHIYLDEYFYTWHCLLGVEKGLADTDRCHYYKLGDDLYLFAWREKIVPTLGVVVVDLDAMRTVGKIFGYQGGEFGRTANFMVGAHARVLNVTERD
jgi:hypothetical protein